MIYILALVIIVVVLLLWKKTPTHQTSVQNFVGQTDKVLSRPIFTDPETKFRIKARAYHSCECEEMPKIRPTLNDNPFIWPYSGSATPYYSQTVADHSPLEA